MEHFNEIEDFLKSIEQVLSALEIEFQGRFFQGRVSPPDALNNLPLRIEYPHFVGQICQFPLEIEFCQTEKVFSPLMKIYFKLPRIHCMLLMAPESGTFLGNLSKKLRLVEDINVGDEDIDRSFIIQSDSPEKICSMFRNVKLCSVIKKLKGFQRMELRENSLNYLDNPFDDGKFNSGYLSQTVKLLYQITEYCTQS